MEILGVPQDHFIGKNVYDYALGNSKMIECLTRSLRGENCFLLAEQYEKKYFDNVSHLHLYLMNGCAKTHY
jgi:hypothetical protein